MDLETRAECSDNGTYPSLTYPVILATQVTASITCLLSILGASLIVFTYAAFKDLRTLARQLLVGLSIADIFVATSHFIGLFTNYERFISVDEDGITFVSNSSYLDAFCVTQGAFTMYGTIASFLLSMLIALYLLVLTHSKSMKPARCLILIIYIISWGIPLVLVAIVAGIQSFGYEPISNPGWCYTGGRSTVHALNSVLADVLSYEFWAFLCMILLTILYVSLFISMYLRCQCCRKVSDSVGYSRARGDLKLLFVPLIFFLLRIWTTIIDAGLHYTHTYSKEQEEFKCSQASAVLSVFAGIGLNAQGFANAILFCAFTKQVREQLMNSSAMTWLRLKLCCKRKLVGDEHRFITSYSVRDETVQVLIKNGRTNYGSSSMGDDQLTLTE